MKFSNKDKKYQIIALCGCLLLVYYLNNTYVINFFDNGFPLLIKRFKSEEIYLLDRPDQVNVVGAVRLVSVVFFAILISVFHVLFIRTLFTPKTGQLFLLVAIGTAVLSGLFFVLFKACPSQENYYYLSRVLKDFLLGPLLPVIFVILSGLKTTAIPSEKSPEEKSDTSTPHHK